MQQLPSCTTFQVRSENRHVASGRMHWQRWQAAGHLSRVCDAAARPREGRPCARADVGPPPEAVLAATNQRPLRAQHRAPLKASLARPLDYPTGQATPRLSTAATSSLSAGVFRSPTAATNACPARTALSASSSWACGYPKYTRTPSPMYFATKPALHSLGNALLVGRDDLAQVLRSMRPCGGRPCAKALIDGRPR